MLSKLRYPNLYYLALLVVLGVFGTGCTQIVTSPVPSTVASPISTTSLASPPLPTELPPSAPTSSPLPPSPTSEPPTPMSVPSTTVPVTSTGQNSVIGGVQVTRGNTTNTVKVHYLLYLPDEYAKDPQKKWPLILFLHGRDERGQDLELLKNQPLPKTLEQQKDFPFIVVSPQLPMGLESWSSLIDPLNALLDQLQTTYAVDTQRMYLTGISMGGFGAWEFALRYPQRFAAVVPIAGGHRFGSNATPDNICNLKELPVWVFHGEQDTDVTPDHSAVMVEALQACGSNVQFTLYPDADHVASWERAYNDPKLYEWLLQQTLK